MDGNISLPEFLSSQPECAPVRRSPFQIVADLVIGTIERARSRRTLRLLDDRMLRDIGVDRGTAQFESDKPFWRG